LNSWSCIIGQNNYRDFWALCGVFQWNLKHNLKSSVQLLESKNKLLRFVVELLRIPLILHLYTVVNGKLSILSVLFLNHKIFIKFKFLKNSSFLLLLLANHMAIIYVFCG
jgi:hypothetical protein